MGAATFDIRGGGDVDGKDDDDALLKGLPKGRELARVC